jgi:hypothetical protein
MTDPTIYADQHDANAAQHERDTALANHPAWAQIEALRKQLPTPTCRLSRYTSARLARMYWQAERVLDLARNIANAYVPQPIKFAVTDLRRDARRVIENINAFFEDSHDNGRREDWAWNERYKMWFQPDAERQADYFYRRQDEVEHKWWLEHMAAMPPRTRQLELAFDRADELMEDRL